MNSGATSGSARANPEPAIKKDGRTEAQFLAVQAADAKVAMDKTWTDLKHSITNNADVRLWTQQYPWIATAAAVAAGVAAGYTITPRSRDEALEMWEQLKEKFKAVEVPPADPSTQTAAAAPPQPSVFGMILKEALKVAAPLLASLASGAMSDKTPAKSDNGHATPDATESNDV